MRVEIRVEGKGARITPAPAKHTAKLTEIQEILRYSSPRVPVKDMRVTDYEERRNARSGHKHSRARIGAG